MQRESCERKQRNKRPLSIVGQAKKASLVDDFCLHKSLKDNALLCSCNLNHVRANKRDLNEVSHFHDS